jgi:hypothetical protein
VFLANVGPVALKAAKQSARGKSAKPSAPNGGNRRARSAPFVPAEHLAANGRGDARRHSPVKALGRWIGRVAQPSARGMGCSQRRSLDLPQAGKPPASAIRYAIDPRQTREVDCALPTSPGCSSI